MSEDMSLTSSAEGGSSPLEEDQTKKSGEETASLTRGFVLPQSLCTSHASFLRCCEDLIDPNGRDWNDEFQAVWWEHLRVRVWGNSNAEKLGDFLSEFEAYAAEVVERTLGEHSMYAIMDAPCFRYGNVVAQVWLDAKTGRNIQRCFRAWMAGRMAGVFFPLTACFQYLHVSVTVQAVVPIAAGQIPEYRGDGVPDELRHCPTFEILNCGLDTLGMPRQTNCQKVRGIEVVEGLDKRLYIVNSLGLLPSLLPTNGQAVPLYRPSYLVRHPAEVPLTSVVQASAVPYALSAALRVPASDKGETLISLLHEQHFNVCCLGLIAQGMLATPQSHVPDYYDGLLRLMCVEIAARSARSVMFSRLRSDVISVRALPVVDEYLSRTVGLLSTLTADRFTGALLPHVRKSFIVEETATTEDLFSLVRETVTTDLGSIIKRLCQLSGLQMMHGTVSGILCRASNHAFSTFLLDANDEALDELVNHAESTATLAPGYVRGVLLPHKINMYCRSQRLEEAWALMRHCVDEYKEFPTDHFAMALLLQYASVIATLCHHPEVTDKLLEKSLYILEKVPAYAMDLPVIPRRLPPYLYFFWGQVSIQLARGYIYVSQRDPKADAIFFSVLDKLAHFSPDQAVYVSHIRLDAMNGLIHTARYADCSKAVLLNTRWERERQSIRPCPLGAHLSDILGALLYQQGMYRKAAARLWEAFTTTSMLRGCRSFPVAEIACKLGYVYYSWGAGNSATLCSALLHLAKYIATATFGLYSPFHMGIEENIIALLLRRGYYVEASRRLHTLKVLPPRYACRIPRDHPVASRLGDLEARLRDAFRPSAVVIIQRCWRDYKAVKLVRAVYKANARTLQRIGRGFLVRGMLSSLSRGALALPDLMLHQHIPVLLSFSSPLRFGSALFSKTDRNWNGEFQLAKLCWLWWDAAEARKLQSFLVSLEDEFTACVHEGMRRTHDGTLTQVPECDTAFIYNNIVFTRIPSGSLHHRLQNVLFKKIRELPYTSLTATLSTIVKSEDGGEFYAEALICMGRQSKLVLTSDGRHGPMGTDAARSHIEWILQTFRGANLTPYDADHIQGVEMILGQDENLYVTNALGLMYNALMGLCEPTIPDILGSHITDDFHAANIGKEREVVEPVETLLLNYKSRYKVSCFYGCYFLGCSRWASGADMVTTLKLFQRISAELEEAGLYHFAVLSNIHEGRGLLQREAWRAALEPLQRNLHLLREVVRWRPYFTSCYTLETARWLLTASVALDPSKRLDKTVFDSVTAAVQYGEPSMQLFTTCERFMMYSEDLSLEDYCDVLSYHRDARARALPLATSVRYATQLLSESDTILKNGCNGSYHESQVLLRSAIRLLEVRPQDTPLNLLGVILTSYASLLTTVRKLKLADRCLAAAKTILQRTSPCPTSLEMVAWRESARTLQTRKEANALQVIRRAVRDWRARMQCDRELAVHSPDSYRKRMASRRHHLLNRVIISEATARVLVADAESEDRYELNRRYRRGRSDAVTHHTHRSRVQLFAAKIDSARLALSELAVASKAAAASCGLLVQQTLMRDALLSFHHLICKSLITEWRAGRVTARLWHLTALDAIIRAEMREKHRRFLAGLVSFEESCWRAVIQRMQFSTKKVLGRYIVGATLYKHAKRLSDEQVLIKEEEARCRQQIMADEVVGFYVLESEITVLQSTPT